MILIAGSANLDFVVEAACIPAPGETILGRDFSLFSGGKGANQAIACARSGDVNTAMLLAVGDDWFAGPIESSLAAAGVRTHLVKTPGKRTGVAFITVSDDGENAIAVAPGANTALSAADLPPLAAVSHLLLQLEIPIAVVTDYARAAKRENVAVILNAAPAQALPDELLSLVDVLVVNEGELAAVSGQDGDIASCIEEIAAPCVVVTLGERGCCAKDGSDVFVQPGFSIDAVDTTAAGDTFCGMLVAAISQGYDLCEALRRSSAAGALACTVLGAQSSIPDHQRVAGLLQKSPAPTNEEMTNLRRFCGFAD